MVYERNVVVAKMKSWLGKKESDGSHKSIIDIYNDISPLPVGYKVTYTDAWCAAAISAAYHAVGYDAIFPLECGCGRMIDKAKKMGIWQEDDGYIPEPGDAILYDWDDNGSGECFGNPEHVGMVEYVSGNTIYVIEGNKSDSVSERKIKINGQYIRGFITPKFDITGSQVEPTESAVVSNKETYAVGDIVKFTGTKHYVSSDAKNGKSCIPGIAEVTQVYQVESSKHPYHLIAIGVDSSTVYGWVNAADIAGVETVMPDKIPEAVNTEDNSVMKKIWDFFSAKIGNDYGVAGIMGNIYAESAYVPNNLQQSYEIKLGFTDESYTKAVDDGSYTNFVHDSAGYGLVQFTYWSFKEDLYNAAKSAGKSIGDLNVQLNVIWKQLGENGLHSKLKSAKSVREASDLVLLKYERPADQGEAVQIKRAKYGLTAYDKYAGQVVIHEIVEPKIDESIDPDAAYTSEVTANGYAYAFNKSVAGIYKVMTSLNLRDGGSANYKVLTIIPEGLKVRNYGYYSDVGGTRWMYVQYTYNGVKYTGFCANEYLTKC